METRNDIMVDQMSRLEELQCIYWDMYKDAYGVRPRAIDTSSWTEDDFTSEFARMSEIIEREAAERKHLEAQEAKALEVRVQDLLECGAKDRAMALRWIHEAEGTNGDDEYLCWTLGLPYRYFAIEGWKEVTV